MIDCTSHVRDRVHPGQELYYRGDKHCHFLTAQVLTNVVGIILCVVIALGHNNDQGVWNKTVKQNIEDANIVGLGDRGYTHSHILSPSKIPEGSILFNKDVDEITYSKVHSMHRSPVEIINSFTKN